jgi:23S rRNA (cytosine1962-C5)-methyltransferase
MSVRDATGNVRSTTGNPRSPATLRLRLTRAAESVVRHGHPWVFADSVREMSRNGDAGDFAVIYDRDDRFLAIGLFDPASPIRVRILHRGKPIRLDDAWWLARLDETLSRRAAILDDATNACRLINGESDGWPALVLDRYDTTLVMKLYSAAWLPHLERTAALLVQRLRPARLVLRLSRNIADAAAARAVTDGRCLAGETPAAPVPFLESGLRFEADVLRGQKTGFFLDQRENRRRVEKLAAGRRVLNAFSFNGGFSLYAARGGATAVASLDISTHALDGAARVFELNRGDARLAQCPHERIHADAFEWLAAATAKSRYDLIVLDPPSLAKREAERAGAITAYRRLAADALRLLAPGGILVAASCSAHVGAEEFFGAVRGAAQQSGRRWTELETTGHAPDHPATFPEAQYLKAIYLRL